MWRTWMQSQDQDIEDTTKSNHHSLLKTPTNEDLCLNPAGIDDALKKICNYFSNRLGIADIEILSFCLRHIFYNTNQIYMFLLPELTICTTESAQLEKDHPRARNMPMRNMPVKSINIQYRIWSSLQEIEVTLERLEPLCQLLISATTNMLNELDRTCRIHTTVRHTETGNTQQEQNGPDSEASNSNHIQSDNNKWQWGLSQAIEKISMCAKNNRARLSFSIQFAILEPMIPAITQIDSALDDLFKSIDAIFSDILPDIQRSASDSDESSATLLLDLIQRCDQILLQLVILAEPLHVLMGQYTLETTLQ
jgi:hypothetical protein